MKDLNKKQKEFLLAISMNKGECISVIGRRIYATAVSCYSVRDIFLREHLIVLEKKKNKEVPKLTNKGRRLVENIFLEINSK